MNAKPSGNSEDEEDSDEELYMNLDDPIPVNVTKKKRILEYVPAASKEEEIDEMYSTFLFPVSLLSSYVPFPCISSRYV